MRWSNMRCPECGAEPDSILEVCQVRAMLKPDGKGGYDYEGWSEPFWDTQKPVKSAGLETLLCEKGHEWLAAPVRD